jgi:hypothetical protein
VIHLPFLEYSAKRHNQNLHDGMGEIVRLIDYLADRSSGQYKPDNPFWYKRNNQYDNVGSSVADSVGDTFQPRRIPQQTPQATSQYYTSPIHRPLPAMDDQRYGTGLSRETIVRIDELKRLANEYPQYCPMQCAIFCCNNGDNKILDDKLEQLRTIDSLAKYYAS